MYIYICIYIFIYIYTYIYFLHRGSSLAELAAGVKTVLLYSHLSSSSVHINKETQL